MTDARGFVRCPGCGFRTTPGVLAAWQGLCPDCRAGFSTPERLAELRESIARAREYFRAVDEARNGPEALRVAGGGRAGV